MYKCVDFYKPKCSYKTLSENKSGACNKFKICNFFNIFLNKCLHKYVILGRQRVNQKKGKETRPTKQNDNC